MFLKLAVCVVAMGVFGCALLAMRQARLQAAHELAQTQLRLRSSDERLFKLRTQIGASVRPEDVRSLLTGTMSLKPIVPAGEPHPQEPTTAPGTRSGHPTDRPSERPSNAGGAAHSGGEPLLAYESGSEEEP